jgi:hypothetical protein
MCLPHVVGRETCSLAQHLPVEPQRHGGRVSPSPSQQTLVEKKPKKKTRIFPL